MKRVLFCLFFAASIIFSFKCAGICASEEDQKIINAVKNSYTFKTYLQDEDINIVSKDGIVTLSGSVQDKYHKMLARDTAENLPGVKSVNDQLQIKEQGQGQYSDAWLSMKVKSALLFHFNEVPIVQVYVKDGIVTLQGEVANENQKKLAEGYAKDIEGVKGLVNELKVVGDHEKQNTNIDDASITAQAKFLLLFRYPVSAFKVDVKTQDGVVTLSGNIENPNEKKPINEMVAGIKGVKKVIDNTTSGQK